MSRNPSEMARELEQMNNPETVTCPWCGAENHSENMQCAECYESLRG